MVSDGGFVVALAIYVSIRFEVRGGFRLGLQMGGRGPRRFQSALRFAVVSDATWRELVGSQKWVSIRFEVRGGFRPSEWRVSAIPRCFNPL